jgi:hypothetical protein
MKKREYNIAVLLPTHKRTDGLSASVFSLLDLAKDLDSIQFLVGIDNNDSIGQNHFTTVIQPRLDEVNANYMAIEFEPLGYAGLNRYFDTLAGHADADWLMCWSDDAIMETHDWDQRIRECTGEFRLLKVHAHNEHPYSIFPIMPAEWREVTGYLSRHQLVDAEVSQLAYFLDIMKIIDVYVTHDRPDLTGRSADETAKLKRYFEGNPSDPRDFHHTTFAKWRQVDLSKLAAYMDLMKLDLTYFNNVLIGKQDPWQRMRENDPNGQTGQFAIALNDSGQPQMVRQQ